MVRFIVLIFSIIFVQTGLSIDLQSSFSKTTSKEVYVLKQEFALTKIIIPFHFNTPKTDFDWSNLMKLPTKRIRRIEYTYADNANTADQAKLNAQRIDSLGTAFKKKINKVVNDIRFETIIQTTENNRSKQFTGFIISYEINSKKLGTALERLVLEDAPTEKKKDRKIFTIDTLESYGYYLFRYYPNHRLPEYTTVSKVLKRNAHWNNKLVVTDVTGSMNPYIVQYLLWLKLDYDPTKPEFYAFFNDGDDNLYSKKKKTIGNTGGIYLTTNSDSYEKLVKLIARSMKNGGGGDCPENNLEAVIRSSNNYQFAKEIVMIADNNATPRDMELLNQIKKPIHVIVCGAFNSEINPAYLKIASQTNGSIHTIEDDLELKLNQKEGDIIEFMGVHYKLENGEFVQVYKM